MNGKALRRWVRNSPHVTIEGLARACGVSYAAMRRALDGKDVSLHTLRQLHRVTGVPYDVLIGDE